MSEVTSVEAEIGDNVVVKDPTENDAWGHSFMGTIADIVDKNGERLYIIEDQDSDFFEMERDHFTLDHEDS